MCLTPKDIFRDSPFSLIRYDMKTKALVKYKPVDAKVLFDHRVR